jgi:colanic acid biosynthesis glycosyl transferase WcaI
VARPAAPISCPPTVSSTKLHRRLASARRVLVHDFAGHPFQVQLSRELARRGHTVLHLHFSELQTPKGHLTVCPGDAEGFRVEGLSLGETFRKSTFIRRRWQELRYARLAAERICRFRPHVVLSANTPLEVQERLATAARSVDARLVLWVQDVYSSAVSILLARRLGWVGRIVGSYYTWIERRLLASCNQVIYISDDFLGASAAWGLPPGKIHIIENWAPLDELPPRPRDNPWSRRHGLVGRICLLYAGTMGMKHNPRLIAELSAASCNDPRVVVVVVSEGPGRQWLERERAERRLDNLVLLDFQPYQDLPDVLASGDILLTLLEPDAGNFAVPSKVLSYLCAERPQLLAVPAANLAARTVRDAEAGLAVEPSDIGGLIEALRRLVDDPDMRRVLGANGRRHALRRFDITRIADRFEVILDIASPAPDPAAASNNNGCRGIASEQVRGSP